MTHTRFLIMFLSKPTKSFYKSNKPHVAQPSLGIVGKARLS